MRLGSLVHVGLEKLYKGMMAGDTVNRSASNAALAMYPDMDADDDTVQLCNQATDTVDRYARRYWHNDWSDFKVIAVEQEFNVPLPGKKQLSKTWLRGFFDLVLLEKSTDRLVLVEHKTTAGDVTNFDRMFDVDTQLPAYVYALEYLQNKGKMPGTSVGEVIVNAIRTKGPSQPKILKNGTVSIAQCDTTKQIYVDALQRQVDDHNIAPFDKQYERRDSLPEFETKWMTRHAWLYTMSDVIRTTSELLATGQLIRHAQAGRLLCTRNSNACVPANQPKCAYRDVCRNDTPEMRASMYQPRKVRQG